GYPETPLRPSYGELLHHPREIVGVLDGDPADGLEQLAFAKHDRTGDAGPHRRHSVNTTVEDRIAPRVCRKIGQVREVLDRVARYKRREIRTLRAEKLRQVAHGAAVAGAEAQQIRKLTTCNRDVELGV